MNKQNYIIALNGSASNLSSNLTVLNHLKTTLQNTTTHVEIIEDLSIFPHFQTERSSANTPKSIVELRQKIKNANALIISTPEYVFSIPSRLKNVLEWLVSTTILQNKPTALITASAQGKQAHQQLKLIVSTLDANFTAETTATISGIKGKIASNGKITDPITLKKLKQIADSLKELIAQKSTK